MQHPTGCGSHLRSPDVPGPTEARGWPLLPTRRRRRGAGARIGVPEDQANRVAETGSGCPSPASPTPRAFQALRLPPGILRSGPPLGAGERWKRRASSPEASTGVAAATQHW